MVEERYDIRIAHDGTWYHEGAPIGRKALVKLFAGVLKRENDGSYWLVTPTERGRIEVEDAPFLAVEISVKGLGRQQEIRFRTNVDDWVPLDDEHRLRVEQRPDTGEPRPYIVVREGLEARILRPVFYQLVELAEERAAKNGKCLGIWSKGSFFELGQPS